MLAIACITLNDQLNDVISPLWHCTDYTLISKNFGGKNFGGKTSAEKMSARFSKIAIFYENKAIFTIFLENFLHFQPIFNIFLDFGGFNFGERFRRNFFLPKFLEISVYSPVSNCRGGVNSGFWIFGGRISIF